MERGGARDDTKEPGDHQFLEKAPELGADAFGDARPAPESGLPGEEEKPWIQEGQAQQRAQKVLDGPPGEGPDEVHAVGQEL